MIGPLLGMFAFGLDGKVAYGYSLVVLVVRRPDRTADRAFAVRLCAEVDPRQPAARVRDRLDTGRAPHHRLYVAGALAGRRGRAARADHGLRLARRARLPPLGRRDAGARDRRHGLSLRRGHRRGVVQRDAGRAVRVDAAVLAWLGLIGHRDGRARPGRPRRLGRGRALLPRRWRGEDASVHAARHWPRATAQAIRRRARHAATSRSRSRMARAMR